MMTADYLIRNGIIIERARREGRSLTSMERNIIAAGRNVAADKGMIRYVANQLEMDGERQWESVLAPIRVDAVFSYFNDPIDDTPAEPHYLVRESNHPALVEGGHVCGDQLKEAGIRVPKTPTFDQWVSRGRKVVRS